jgi:hypothetical protein
MDNPSEKPALSEPAPSGTQPYQAPTIEVVALDEIVFAGNVAGSDDFFDFRG